LFRKSTNFKLLCKYLTGNYWAKLLAENWPSDGAVKNDIEGLTTKDWGKAEEYEKADGAFLLLSRIEDSVNMGKGQFSQLLAEEIKRGTKLKVPGYIRKAVIWACGGDPDDEAEL
jgi:putative ATP-dependent endonuclease of the OLD family